MSKSKESVKRTLHFKGPTLDQKIELKRVVALDIPKKMFIIEEIKEGEYRLTYSKEFLPDISMLEGVVMIRED